MSRCLLRNHCCGCQYLALLFGFLEAKTYRGDLVGSGVLDDGDQTLKLLRGELTRALLQVDIGLLAHQVGCEAQSALSTLYRWECETVGGSPESSQCSGFEEDIQ